MAGSASDGRSARVLRPRLLALPGPPPFPPEQRTPLTSAQTQAENVQLPPQSSAHTPCERWSSAPQRPQRWAASACRRSAACVASALGVAARRGVRRQDGRMCTLAGPAGGHPATGSACDVRIRAARQPIRLPEDGVAVMLQAEGGVVRRRHRQQRPVAAPALCCGEGTAGGSACLHQSRAWRTADPAARSGSGACRQAGAVRTPRVPRPDAPPPAPSCTRRQSPRHCCSSALSDATDALSSTRMMRLIRSSPAPGWHRQGWAKRGCGPAGRCLIAVNLPRLTGPRLATPRSCKRACPLHAPEAASAQAAGTQSQRAAAAAHPRRGACAAAKQPAALPTLQRPLVRAFHAEPEVAVQGNVQHQQVARGALVLRGRAVRESVAGVRKARGAQRPRVGATAGVGWPRRPHAAAAGEGLLCYSRECSA